MREKIIFNNSWLFSKESDDISKVDDSSFISITLPHTWNAMDGQDGGGDYYRGVCTYKKSFNLTEEDLSKELFIEFEAIMSSSKVVINRKKEFIHHGGFQTFRIYLNDVCHAGENEILVFADNRSNNYVYPQFADFTFFGGIYRDTYLIKTNKTHFDLSYFGTKGIKITPQLIDEKWFINVESFITNFNDNEIVFELIDEGKVIDNIKINEVKTVTFEVKNPHLWNGRIDPHLYTIKAKILNNADVIDEIEDRVGLRTFYVDPQKGFYLNGKPYHLHGVSRHQDRLNLGWAITKKEHEEDMELIKEVGATTIRLAHYQHAQYFYDLCDQEGMVVWAEIPYISNHMDTGKENVFSQMKELVLQNYNHTSICFWGLSNEITMRGTTKQLIDDHKELNALVKSLDKTRLTTIANVSMTKMDSEICKITDVISYNHYFGWYAGIVDQNGPRLDKFHSLYPSIPLGLSEYGCEAILDWHSETPMQGDYTEEYQAYYHEEMLKTFASRPYLWSTHVWNMFDFAADNRDEGGEKGRNHKGLVTYDRKTKKDSFYIYKAYWNNEDKFIHITSKRYKERSLDSIKVKIYTNLDEVTLFNNDVSLGTKKVEDHKVIFDVALTKGENHIKATSGNYIDETTFIKVDEENEKYHLKDNSDIVNWFDKEGNQIEFNFKEGYLNIDSPIKDIIATPLGKAIMDLTMKFGLKKMGMGEEGPNDDLLEMMSSMSVRKISKLAGSNVITPEILFAINEILNQIKIGEKDLRNNPKTIQISYLNGKISINTYDGYFNLNSKIGPLLKSQFIKEVMKSILLIKPEFKEMTKGFKFFVIKQFKVISLLKLTKKVDDSLAQSINEILTNIKI